MPQSARLRNKFIDIAFTLEISRTLTVLLPFVLDISHNPYDSKDSPQQHAAHERVIEHFISFLLVAVEASISPVLECCNYELDYILRQPRITSSGDERTPVLLLIIE